ncbi:MAG: hypothetical protein DRP45_02385 [Candidatus Zixiibacteriota bacterium]|nr:MAG: hypothetical protein DRP45_02385 [candidate division Zixibacteria bacterium]
MKKRYVAIMCVLLLLAFWYVRAVLLTSTELHPHLDDALQGAAVFAALIASVIALSATDRKRLRAKTGVEVCVEPSQEVYPKSKFVPELIDTFRNHEDPVISRRVIFKLKNNSGFTLNKPMLAFRLPKDKRHPAKLDEGPDGSYYVLTFRSNLFNSRDEFRSLEFEDSVILSNSNLPYWNADDEIKIWIRMVLGEDAFSVKVSVNSENAEGVTKEVQVNPAAPVPHLTGGSVTES